MVNKTCALKTIFQLEHVIHIREYIGEPSQKP